MMQSKNQKITFTGLRNALLFFIVVCFLIPILIELTKSFPIIKAIGMSIVSCLILSSLIGVLYYLGVTLLCLFTLVFSLREFRKTFNGYLIASALHKPILSFIVSWCPILAPFNKTSSDYFKKLFFKNLMEFESEILNYFNNILRGKQMAIAVSIAIGTFTFYTFYSYKLITNKNTDTIAAGSFSNQITKANEILSYVYETINTCNRETHPSLCNNDLKERAVKVRTADSAGSAGIIFSNRNAGVIATAAHVILDDSGKLSEKITLKHPALDSSQTFVVCINLENLKADTRKSKKISEYSTDYAFILAAGNFQARHPHPTESEGTKRLLAVEFAGESPNVIPMNEDFTVNGVISSSTDLWTGASGSLVFDTNGGLVGVYVAGGGDNGAITKLTGFDRPDFVSEEVLDILVQNRCYNYPEMTQVTDDEISTWLELFALKKRVATNSNSPD